MGFGMDIAATPAAVKISKPWHLLLENASSTERTEASDEGRD